MLNDCGLRNPPLAVGNTVHDRLAGSPTRDLAMLAHYQAFGKVHRRRVGIHSLKDLNELFEQRPAWAPDSAERVTPGTGSADVIQARVIPADEGKNPRVGEEPFGTQNVESPEQVDI